ncbi:MAG: hypothetical protein SLAVMIC_00033 [uncultured marine phage]|uniref:Lipoprotein n=1 Tax=uncultured marine phage TaxID=707152 RepID=A0A8D9CCC2_9VIRU|nr:MAG: hypothetical protein SLAVMIC_00033 [uncultured marine phage]
MKNIRFFLTLILSLFIIGCTDSPDKPNPITDYEIKTVSFNFDTKDNYKFEMEFGYKIPVSKSYSDSLVYSFIDKYSEYTANEFYFTPILPDTCSWAGIYPCQNFRIYLDSIGYIKL